MRLEDVHYFLDLPELIRVNQLVRNGVDSEAFINWFESLNGEQRNTLIMKVLEFALQAHGRDDEIILEGIARANAEEFAPKLLELLRDRNAHWCIGDWLHTCSDEQKLAALKVVVEVFGIAEARRLSRCRNLAAEKKEWYCNHWWHRDLLNPLVVTRESQVLLYLHER